MQFNSLYFILFFLPFCVLGYYLIGRKNRALADWFLIGISAVFYGIANVWYPVMLVLLMLINWGITMQIRDSAKSPGRSKHWMIFGVVLNAAFLGIFKYTNFFIDNLNHVLKTSWPVVNLILPLGISFIIFSQISWIVDSWNGKTEDVSFREYALFSLFFPKLTEGPITLTRDFIPEVRKEDRYRFDSERLAVGIQMFVLGLGKKVLLADALGTAVDWYFDTILYRTIMDSVVVMFAYTFQIYFDFSGYSDMALGISQMLGFFLPANFNSPYKACTLTDFWRRWHISLTTFLREYIYFPLGGSRQGTLKTCRNILIVYLVSGIWHGASWSFVLWGLLHGIAQVIERLLGKWYLKIWKGIRWVITFCYVSYLWMLFRCGSWDVFLRYRWHLTIDKTRTLSMDFAENFHIPGLESFLGVLGISGGMVGVISMIVLFACCFFICLCCPNNQERKYKNSAISCVVIVILLCVCLLSLSNVSTFIYNDF